jgi:hypothetical protein
VDMKGVSIGMNDVNKYLLHFLKPLSCYAAR